MSVGFGSIVNILGKGGNNQSSGFAGILSSNNDKSSIFSSLLGGAANSGNGGGLTEMLNPFSLTGGGGKTDDPLMAFLGSEGGLPGGYENTWKGISKMPFGDKIVGAYKKAPLIKEGHKLTQQEGTKEVTKTIGSLWGPMGEMFAGMGFDDTKAGNDWMFEEYQG